MIDKPSHFEAYWAQLDAELARLSSQPVLEALPRHSSEHFKVYAVRLTSYGPYRIFGFFSVPNGLALSRPCSKYRGMAASTTSPTGTTDAATSSSRLCTAASASPTSRTPPPTRVY